MEKQIDKEIKYPSLKAIAKRNIDNRNGEKYLLIKPNWKWFFNMNHQILLTKDDIEGDICERIEYY